MQLRVSCQALRFARIFARVLPDYAKYGPAISITYPLHVLEQSGKIRGAVMRSDVPDCMTEERLAVL
jgi:hypothetical protein